MEQKTAAITVEAAGRRFVSYAAYVSVDDHPPAARPAALAVGRVARACVRPQAPLSNSEGGTAPVIHLRSRYCWL